MNMMISYQELVRTFPKCWFTHTSPKSFVLTSSLSFRAGRLSNSPEHQVYRIFDVIFPVAEIGHFLLPVTEAVTLAMSVVIRR